MAKKQKMCRICKKRPVWRGGDVKNPGPVCKRCYHKGWAEEQKVLREMRKEAK